MANVPNFSLRLEFELYDDADFDPCDDCFTMGVTLEDGTHYGLTVCTYRAVDWYPQERFGTAEELVGRYCVSPDLIVEKADRGLLQRIVTDLLSCGQMRPHWIERQQA